MKTKVMGVRVTQKLWDAISVAARKARITASAFVRDTVKARLESKRENQSDLPQMRKF